MQPVRLPLPQPSPHFGGVMDDLQARKKILKSQASISNREESIRQEQTAIQQRSDTLKAPILDLPENGQLTGI